MSAASPIRAALFAAALVALPSLASASPDDVVRGLWREQSREGSDWIPVLTLYHAKTPAMPAGRMIGLTTSPILKVNCSTVPSTPA